MTNLTYLTLATLAVNIDVGEELAGASPETQPGQKESTMASRPLPTIEEMTVSAAKILMDLEISDFQNSADPKGSTPDSAATIAVAEAFITIRTIPTLNGSRHSTRISGSILSATAHEQSAQAHAEECEFEDCASSAECDAQVELMADTWIGDSATEPADVDAFYQRIVSLVTIDLLYGPILEAISRPSWQSTDPGH